MKLIPIIIGSTCIITYVSYKYLKYNVNYYDENYIEISSDEIIDVIDTCLMSMKIIIKIIINILSILF